MSLTASMWTSVSGLLAHGERMNVIGNNISNVNTVGFKGQRMDFQDFVYQAIGTASGVGQTGRGTSIGAIMNDYSQGSLETSTMSTDIAISGNGFFQVKPLTNNQSYYTRAGNFRFSKDGYLVDPHGYVLQGWSISKEKQLASGTSQRNSSGIIGAGAPVDIKLDTFTCPPRHTTAVTLPINLRNSKTASEDDRSTDATDPFFALLKRWNATQQPALGQTSYAYQTSINVYDEGGREHKLTVYFDRVANNNPSAVTGYTDSESYWEYIVTMDPSEDVRDFSATTYDPNGATTPDVPDKLKGLLGAGTLTFSSSGQLKDMTAFVPHTNWWTGAAGQETVNLDNWIAAPFDQNGYPLFAPNFSGTAGLAYAYEDGNWTQPNVNAAGRLTSVDFGLRSKDGKWHYLADPSGKSPATYGTSGLVKASGLSDWNPDIQSQKTGDFFTGWYEWEPQNVSTGTYTILTKNNIMPTLFDQVWGKATPPNNGTRFDWTINLDGNTTVIDPNASPYTVPVVANQYFEPVPTFTPGANPNDAQNFKWEATVAGKLVHANIYRKDGIGDILNPLEFDVRLSASNKIWSDPPVPSPDYPGYDRYIAEDNMSWIDLPPGISLDTLRADRPTFTQVGNDAQHEYWDMKIAGATPAVTGVQTLVGISPGCSAPPDLTNHNVTEAYWYNGANPDIVLVTYDIPPLPAHPDANPPVAGQPPVDDYPTFLSGATKKPAPPALQGNKYFLNGMDGLAESQSVTATCLGDNFYEHNGVRQDGYTYGDLRYVNVSTDGVLSASYSNGVTLQLYQIVLYDFPSTQNLRREGGNLFTETRESGPPSSGAAGTGTFGTTEGYALEQSNVDLAREFVNMIATQRGFQANSKNITTVDTMLETVIQMKR